MNSHVTYHLRVGDHVISPPSGRGGSCDLAKMYKSTAHQSPYISRSLTTDKMTSYTADLVVTFEDGKVCIQQNSKSKRILITNKAWNKIKTLEATVSNYAEAGKEGRWFLDQDWYIHTNVFTFPKKRVPKKYKLNNEHIDNNDAGDDAEGDTVCLIHIRRWYLFNDKHRPGKEGLTFNQNTWQLLKEYTISKKQEQSKTYNAARTTTGEASCDVSTKRKAESDDEETRGQTEEAVTKCARFQ